VYHVDLFRLEGPNSPQDESVRLADRTGDRERLMRLGLDEYFYGNGVCVVEWADRFPDLMPEQARWIRFEMQSPERRVIHIE
jgi:tRNA threonylcarbamoyladenosine biosynthesis protein TsaE